MSNSKYRIQVDPRCRMNYASYYIVGLNQVFGKGCVKYGPLPGVDVKTDRDYRRGFYFVVTNSAKACLLKVYVDFGDWEEMDETAYQWCDVYAKINLRDEDKARDKVMLIGPSFGVTTWNWVETLWRAGCNYLKIAPRPRLVHYVATSYLYQIVRRSPYSTYARFADSEDPDYVFSFNTLWYGQLADECINKYRGDFMNACCEVMPRFEGGFVYLNSPDVTEEFPPYPKYLEEYAGLISDRRMSMRAYNERIRRSAFVFNTPSVANCHGWKLPEYLAMGKAIISTPLSHAMPGEFLPGVHYLEVSDAEEIKAAIIRLHEDNELRQRLKRNAYNYFIQWLTPEKVVLQMCSSLGVSS